MKSREVSEALGREFVTGILRPLQGEIRSWAQAEARQAIQEALAAPEFRRELQEQLREAVIESAREEGAAELPPRTRRRATGSRSAGDGVFSLEKPFLWGGVTVLVLLLVVGFYGIFRGEGGGEPTGVEPVPASMPGSAGDDRGQDDGSGDLSIVDTAASRDPLRATWNRFVAEAPAEGTLARQLRDEGDALFACWYPMERRLALANAARGGEEARFDACVQGYPIDDSASITVYTSQLAAREALREIRAENSCAGRAPGNRTDLDDFTVDGLRGPNTYNLLNELATCAGAGAGFRVGPDSPVDDYLVALYLSLKKLGAV